MRIRAWSVAIMVAVASLAVAPALAQNATPAALAQQRADAAQRVLTRLLVQYNVGNATLDDVGVWGERYYQAKRETGVTGCPLIAAAQEWTDKMRALEALAKQRVQAGAATTTDADKATYYRLEAEGALAKARQP